MTDDPALVLLGFGGVVLAMLAIGRGVSWIVLWCRWRGTKRKLAKEYNATRLAVQGQLFADLDPALAKIDWEGFTKQMEGLIKPNKPVD